MRNDSERYDSVDVSDAEATIDDFALAGITLPPRIEGRGRPPAEVAEAWIEVVEQLMGRGITSPYRLHKVLDIPQQTAAGWMRKVRQRWGAGVEAGELSVRREQLYQEADQVARMAWASAINATTDRARADALNIVLKANDRKAKLFGLEEHKVTIASEVTVKGAVDVVAQVEAQFGLTPGVLAQLGREVSVAFSARGAIAAPAPDDVVDAVEVIAEADDVEDAACHKPKGV